MSPLNTILWSLLIFVLTACNINPLFSSLSLSENSETVEPPEIQSQPESDTNLEDTQVGLQTPPALAPEPTALSSDAIAKADIEELLLINLYERVSPSVVKIVVTVDNNESLDEGNDLFPTQGQGSGFVYDSKGHIITNNHVIAEANRVDVTFFDGTTIEAIVIGNDMDSDLAVIKVDLPKESLRPVYWADSNKILVGQRAVAIGNPFGLDGTLTSGIISALGRSLPTENLFSIPEIVQTDAAINPGNSGGPLLNSQGEVIGVNTAIVPRRSALGERSFLGVGFAIPSNLVKRIVPALIENGKYQHPWLGVSGVDVKPEIAAEMNLPKSYGALVSKIISGSPADKAGLRAATRDFELDSGSVAEIGGDVIISIEDEEIHTFSDLIVFLSRRGTVGEAVTLTIIRNGKEQTLELMLEARPETDEIN